MFLIGRSDHLSNVLDGTTIVAGKVTGYARHGLNRALGRDGGKAAKSTAILDAVKHPKKVQFQSGGRVQYTGKYAGVVLNKAGKVVTTWPKNRRA